MFQPQSVTLKKRCILKMFGNKCCGEDLNIKCANICKMVRQVAHLGKQGRQYKMFAGKFCVTKLFGISSYRQEGNIKMYLQTVGFENYNEPLGFTAAKNFLNNYSVPE